MFRRLLIVLPALAMVPLATVLPEAEAESDTTIVFNGEGNRLNAYDAATGEKQLVIHSAADAEDGSHTSPSPPRDINAQLCFFTAKDGSTRFIAGEDTGQGSHGTDGQPGWGIFELKGKKVGKLSAVQVGKLKTTFQTSDNEDERAPYESNPENYGCGLLSDGRVVTSDVGNQYPLTPSNGQLIVWFPDPEKGFDTYDVKHCKIDTEIPTSGGIYVDEQDRVYVASNRPSAPVPDRIGGIYRYSGAFPTSPSDCEAKAAAITREPFVQSVPVLELLTPSAIVPSGKGTFYVSSVFDGRIAEYDTDGGFIRMIVEAAPGVPPYDTGTPYGIGVGPDGTLYYADLGVVVGPPPGPGDKNGTVRRVRFVNGEPQAPEVMDEGLEFPDGIGVLRLASTGQEAAAPAVVKAAQTSRGQVDSSTLPSTGREAPLVLAAAAFAVGLLVRRVRTTAFSRQ